MNELKKSLLEVNEVDIIKMIPEFITYMKTYYMKNDEKLKVNEKKIYVIKNIEKLNIDLRVMTACDREYCNCKIIGGIDTLFSTHIAGLCVLFNTDNMNIESIVDARIVTGIRTAAINSIMLEYLAPPQTKNVLIIGCGKQSFFQIFPIYYLFKSSEIFVFDRSQKKIENLVNFYKKRYGINLNIVKNFQEAIQIADVIITLTPSRNPIILMDQIKNNIHISAIGADTEGKQEIDPNIIKNSTKLVVDNIQQAITVGEIHNVYKSGELLKSDIYAEVGEIIRGLKKGRTKGDKITVFDSTGTPIQDLIAHRWLYDKYKDLD